MFRKRCLYTILIIIFALSLFACEQSRLSGVRERNVLEAEPELLVVLDTGEETMMLEEYVVGVVAGEMKKDWPENAYAAQAIIARTFALKHMSEEGTNVISGSYQFAQEYKPENITEEVIAAVEKTRGEVLVHNDDYINAWFHASAGGQTTSAKVGLAYEEDEPPYIISVNSPDDQADDDVRNWTIQFSEQDISNALSALDQNIESIESITIADSDDTGRVIDFQIEGSEGLATVNAARFRTEIGSKDLKSTMISEVSEVEGGFSFNGSGFGHGVGMSQWGAYEFARQEKTPEEIALHYFGDVEIVKEYD